MVTQSRYSKFVKNGKCEFVPFIPILKQNSDYYVKYNPDEKRLDGLSYQYYGNPNYGWVILQANSEYGSLEFSIPKGSVIRIPFPIESVLEEYNMGIKKYRELYG
jgi:hypothetical protein